MASQSRACRPRRGAELAGGSSRDWAWLHADPLRSVFRRLAGERERVRFAAVCKNWGSAAAAWPARPWLVGSRRNDRSGTGSATASAFWISHASDRGLVPFSAAAAVPIPAGSEFLSSTRGYVAICRPEESPRAITLYNPVTARRIPLPAIGFFKRWHDVGTVVLSADPDTAAEWSAVAVGYPANCIAYYSSATNDWTPVTFNSAGYAGVEHFRGQFYVAFKAQIGVLDLDDDVPTINVLEIAGDDDDGGSDSDASSGAGNKYAGLEDEDPPRKRIVESHLVECNGELLLVVMHDEVQYTDSKAAAAAAIVVGGRSSRNKSDERWVDVFQVEWVQNGRVRLLRMEDLGSYALFIDRNHAFALSPEEFPAILANCIYIVEQQGHPDGLVRVVNFNDDTNEWVVGDEDIFPDDGKLGCTLVGWALRGWVLPKY
uniref:KIB1-4 beta-propeller domain-containing protein n=1 Tax=Leersia perrieri TaxID=77586 RepID=A0A0D9XLM0_9ORYZ